MPLPITLLQKQLTQLGFDIGQIDGIEGPKTKAAIVAFQRKFGLVPDGIVGIKTETALSEESAKASGNYVPPAGPMNDKGEPAKRSTNFPSGITAELVQAAQDAQRKWNIPASVTLAQFGLESAWGTRMPSGSHNPFGIKAAAGQPFVTAHTREVVHGQSVYIDAKFRKFDSFAEAFDAHGKLIATVHAYATAMHTWETTKNVERFVAALAPVYATDPHYHDLIMSIIRSKGLDAYDLA